MISAAPFDRDNEIATFLSPSVLIEFVTAGIVHDHAILDGTEAFAGM
jgi:hypothetical protein